MANEKLKKLKKNLADTFVRFLTVMQQGTHSSVKFWT
jgi:hypothetical protein